MEVEKGLPCEKFGAFGLWCPVWIAQWSTLTWAISRCDPMSKQCSAMMPCVSNVFQMCFKCVTFSLRALPDFAPRPHLQWFHRTGLGLMPSGAVLRLLRGHQVWVNTLAPSSSTKYSKFVCLLLPARLFPFGQFCTSSYRRAVEINPFREIMPRNLCKAHYILGTRASMHQHILQTWYVWENVLITSD